MDCSMPGLPVITSSRVHSDLCPLIWWCHPTISSSAIPFSSCLQSFPASGSFSMSQFFTSGGQSIEFQLQDQSFQWIFRSDRMWSIGEGNGKPLQYSCLAKHMNSMKRQKHRTLKDELPRSVGAQYATGDQWRNNSRKNDGMESKQNNTQLWMRLVMEARSSAVESNIT